MEMGINKKLAIAILLNDKTFKKQY